MKNKNYSSIYRFIHWGMALCFLLLLITIFLRLTWMNKYGMAGIIEHYLETIGQDIPHEDAIKLAKEIREPMWQWHFYFGYALIGLFSIRFSLPFFGKMRFQNPSENGLSLKEKTHRWIYLIFYACVVISLTTGIIIEHFPDLIHQSAKAVHKASIYYLLGYIGLHIFNVLRAEFTDHKGLISKIVSGSPARKKKKLRILKRKKSKTA